MTNKRPSRRRLKKWQSRAGYIVRRGFDRGPDWFIRQADLIARQHRTASRLGIPLLRAFLIGPDFKHEALVDCMVRLFKRIR